MKFTDVDREILGCATLKIVVGVLYIQAFHNHQIVSWQVTFVLSSLYQDCQIYSGVNPVCLSPVKEDDIGCLCEARICCVTFPSLAAHVAALIVSQT